MLIILIIALNVLSKCHSAGFTTHNIAASRASQYEYFNSSPRAFYGLSQDRFDAIQGGAPFPDYLYTCGDDHDAGEEAHWTPFQMAAADYIRLTYPNWMNESRNDVGAGLVAFMLGVTSHYIADINWHGLESVPSGEGLIRTMGYADFNCTSGDLCQAAHTAADTGGEFVAPYILNISWYPTQWYIPTTDLVNIYASMGTVVQPEWINECAVLFYVGSVGVSKLGDVIYETILSKYVGSLLLENYLDFHIGGVDDDAAWTSFMWNRFADWVTNGTPEEPPMDIHSNRQLFSKRKLSQKAYISKLKSVLTKHNILPIVSIEEHKNKGIFNIKKSSNGISIEFNLSTNSPVIKELFYEIANSLLDDYVLSEYNSYDIDYVKSKLYERVDDIFATKEKEIKNNVESNNNNLQVIEIASGKNPHQYFGSSITISDFTDSGEDCDILIGSYGSGTTGGPQYGNAHIYFGKACNSVENTLSNESDVFSFRPFLDTSSMNTNRKVNPQSNEISKDTSSHVPSYERFGYSSAACDVNGDGIKDAIICSPSFEGRNVSAAVGNYSGRCDIFIGPFHPNSHYFTSGVEPSITILGDKVWGQFGSAVTVGDVDGDDKEDLIISSPTAGAYSDIFPNDRGDLSSQGAVYIYLAQSLHQMFDNQNAQQKNKMKMKKEKEKEGTWILQAREVADYTLQPSESFQWFGKSLEVARFTSIGPVLFVGAPIYISQDPDSKNSAVGKIYAYTFDNHNAPEKEPPSNSHSNTNSKDYLFSVTGCHHSGRTGHSIAFSNTLQYLAVSETGYNASSSETKSPPHGRGTTILRSGRVILFPFSLLLSQSEKNKDLTTCDDTFLTERNGVDIIRGDHFEGRLGSSMKFASSSISTKMRGRDGGSSDVLVASSPLAFKGAGLITSYQLSKRSEQIFPALNITQNWNFSGETISAHGRLGNTIQISDKDGKIFTSAILAEDGNNVINSPPNFEQYGKVLKISQLRNY